MHQIRDKEATLKILNDLDGEDQEADHAHADGALVAFLRHLGHDDVADAFENAAKRVNFWYA